MSTSVGRGLYLELVVYGKQKRSGTLNLQQCVVRESVFTDCTIVTSELVKRDTFHKNIRYLKTSILMTIRGTSSTPLTQNLTYLLKGFR